MGNISPYVEKIEVESALINEFNYNYSLDEMNYTPFNYFPSATPPYATGTQTAIVSGNYDTEPLRYFYKLGGIEILNTVIPTNTIILSIPFYNSDGETLFYLRAKVTNMGEEYEYRDGDYKRFYKSLSISCYMSDTEDNQLLLLSSFGGSLGNWKKFSLDTMDYTEQWFEEGIFFTSVFGEKNISDELIKFVTVGLSYSGFNRYQSPPYNYTISNFSPLCPFEVWGGKPKTYLWNDSTGEVAEEPEDFGGGSFDDSSDLIDLPSVPSVGVSTSGFSNIYSVTSGELQGFVNELFPPFAGISLNPLNPPSDIIEGIENLGTCLYNICSNVFPLAQMFINKGLLDYVISLHLIPVAPNTGSRDNISVGWKDFNQTATLVTSDYVDFNCGTLDIKEYWKLFPDYLTTAQLYLPFIGFVPLQPEFFQNGFINVYYRFNVVDGSFMVYVRSTSSKSELSDSIIAQYSGSCCVQLPITAVNYANIYSGILNGALNISLGVASGNVVGVGQSVAEVANMRPELAQSNSYSSTSSFLGERYPYILIARPAYFNSRDYIDETGVPLGVKKKFYDEVNNRWNLSGFVSCENPIVTGFSNIDEEEKEKLKDLLIDGIYI